MKQRRTGPQGPNGDRQGQTSGPTSARRKQGPARDRLGAYEKRFRKIYMSLVAILLVFIVVFSFMIRGKIREILGKGEPTEAAEFEVFPYHTLTGNGGGTSQGPSDTDQTSDYTFPDGWETVNPAPAPPTSTAAPTQTGGSGSSLSTAPTEVTGTDPTTGTDIEDPTETSESPEPSETETAGTEATESTAPSTAAESTPPAAGDPEAEPGDDD